jgi:hypothetical protein
MKKQQTNRLVPDLYVWACGVGTLWVIMMHVQAGMRATGLYRDEAGGVALATQETWSRLWELIEFDAFGVFWFGVLRGWCALVGSENDLSLRLLGTIDAVLVIVAIWYAARKIGAKAPVMALALAVFHPVIFRWSSTLRGYGLGAALIVMVYVSVWQVINNPKPRYVLIMTAAALAAVHTVYYNAVLFFAIGVGGMCVCARHRLWRRMCLIGAVGVFAALTMLPYIDLMQRSGAWNKLIRIDIDSGQIVSAWAYALNLARPGFVYLWLVIVALVTGASLLPSREKVEKLRYDLPIFAGVSMAVGIIMFYLFFMVLSYPVWPPYFMIIIVFIAVCLEGLAARLWITRWGSVGATTLMIIMGLLCASSTYAFSQSRLTNVDQLAQSLTTQAKTGDLIIVHHWSTGVSFARYYHGQAPWQTVPPLDDHRVHRYDQLKSAMQQSDPIAPLLERMGQVLKSGGRVWIVRRAPLQRYDEPPPILPTSPKAGASMYPYLGAWQRQVDQFILDHAQRMTRVDAPSDGMVMRTESLHVALAQGWK